MSEALRKAAEQTHAVLEQLRDLSPKQTAALFALRAALAETEQSEPVAYQYRWTNPDNRQHVHPAELEWKPVELRHCKTIPEEAAQLERYTYDGKPAYEVRKLFATPPRREPYPLPDDLYDSKDWRDADYAGRVEWLHTMYEGKKAELDAYLTGREPLATEKYTELAHRIASKYTHRSDPKHIAYTFLPHTLEQFVRSLEAEHGITGGNNAK